MAALAMEYSVAAGQKPERPGPHLSGQGSFQMLASQRQNILCKRRPHERELKGLLRHRREEPP